MALQLELQKPGQKVEKLSLSLNKGSRFTIELYWDSAEDLDAHALLCHNDGNGAKVSSLDEVLSTYNCKKTNPNGTLRANPDGSFSTPEGSLTHSGDARTGIGPDIDEVIIIDGAKVPSRINEIPVFVTIHPSGVSNFGAVKSAGIRIKDDSGKELGSYYLSNEFGSFDAVQMGSLMLGSSGWEYAAVGNGFNGDFNTILDYFS